MAVGINMVVPVANRRCQGLSCADFQLAAGHTRAEGVAVQSRVCHMVEVSTEPDAAWREERQGGNQGVIDEKCLVFNAIGPVGVGEVKSVPSPGEGDASEATA